MALLGVGILIVSRAELSYDLGLFLPPPKTAEQRLLLERPGESPGSRYLLVAADERGSDATLEDLGERLSLSQQFDTVATDASLQDMESVPEPLWTYRYLLRDTDFSAPALATELQRRASELSLVGGGRYAGFIQADPLLNAFSALELARATAKEHWLTDDGRRILLAETRAPAFDLRAQAQALATLKDTLTAFPANSVEISGVGVFGVELRDTIHAEARLRSVLASAVILLVLWAFYRKIAVLWLAAIPLAAAVLAGLASTALVFERVHGVTLAFGFTLIGIAIDYPLHLLSHARHTASRRALNDIWPTLRLGALSTLLAYIAVALSGSEGLAQLGLFTGSGIAAAAATTRWVLPILLTGGNSDQNGAGQQRSTVALRLWHLPLGIAVASAMAVSQWNGRFWNNDLSALSPVPQEKLLRDTALRNAIGAPDLRYLIELRDAELPLLLERLQHLSEQLPSAVDAGLVQGFRSASALVPGASAQERRRRALPDSQALRTAIATAVAQTPFKPSAFGPMLAGVEQSRELPLLTPETYRGSPLENLLGQLLYTTNGEWVTLVTLFTPQDISGIERWLEQHAPGARFIDLKRASRELVVSYRTRAISILAIALGLIVLLLAAQTPLPRAIWSLATMLTSVGSAGLLVFAFVGPLDLYHLIGLLLVAGLGLDYALFLSRPADPRGKRDARHAVWACAASTIGAFGILAFSDIPALKALGATVTIGTSIAIGAARAGLKKRLGLGGADP